MRKLPTSQKERAIIELTLDSDQEYENIEAQEAAFYQPPPIIVLKLAALSPIMRVHILTNCFSLRKYSKLQKENQYKKYLGTDKQLKAAPGKKFLILAFFCLENLHRAEICLEY